jgi:hypothetical protein
MSHNLYKLLKVLAIDTDEVLVEVAENTTLRIPKKRLPEFVIAGDFIRHCEHGFYDVVDENGTFIYR